MVQQTAIEWFVEQLPVRIINTYREEIEKAKQMENEQMISFNKWMRENDTAENAEQYANYSDKDMLIEFKQK